MIPNVVLERVDTPDGEMVLSQRGRDFSIRVRGVELMNSRSHGSEDELGRITCQPLADRTAPRVLIGGLGLGYTLRAALDVLPSNARLDLVEIMPAVVRWNRAVVGALASHPLDDPRVTVIEADVGLVIGRSTAHYDAILLDVDNGPDGILETNAALYRRTGLERAHAALTPRGVLAVWSSFDSPTFTLWLRQVGFDVELVRSNQHGARHFVWLARR
ncbi:MAG: Spermine synthase [Deltaproteobacteria bacterium]|nr:Spermine synthase [Deltaproteobacteria bacterium]